ncbi:MAG TPA: alkyl sulfatase dimerization domain-containing protein [Acidimicrobiales bacterium]|nr:alkyl sulfatase dimerization domain-containing protein [Acidimicrobiales bacterium]
MTDTPVLPASFEPDSARTTTGPTGEIAHESLVAHAARFEQRLIPVGDGAWCMIGNGLSNQNFVRGPEGIIAIDSGESIEEMTEALEALREVTDEPVVAVIYTHFHYVNGTQALFNDGADRSIPIWSHSKVTANLRRQAIELNAVGARGLVQQFGIFLPEQGADGVLVAGLGPRYRKADHAPFTPGFVPPTNTIDEGTEVTIAGLRTILRPAPSDADDNVTIVFPDLGICINNIVWPVLFNVFAIRGEEYRDPRVLLTGIDEVLSFAPEHLIGAHGPPISGAAQIQDAVTRSRDAIQFLWDQTVRGINLGLTMSELTEFVQLPSLYDEHYLTQQHYGLAEHHVRQIFTGLRGWFDGDESTLFPLPTLERCTRLIDGFGGRTEVAAQARAALEAEDLRWALELSTWLVRSKVGPDGRADGGTPDERELLADALRAIGQRTTSANIRNWALTRARELEGNLDLNRFRSFRFSRGAVLAADPDAYVHGLRVVLDPDAAQGVDEQLAWHFADGTTVGLHVRNCVAATTDGADASTTLVLSLEAWANVLGGKTTLSEAIDAGDIVIEGSPELAVRVLRCFDHPPLRS